MGHGARGGTSPLAAVLLGIAVSCVAAIAYTLVQRAGAPEPAALEAEPSPPVEPTLAAEPDPEPAETAEPAPAPEPTAETQQVDSGPPSFETPPLVAPPPTAAAPLPVPTPSPAPIPPQPAETPSSPPDRLRAAMQAVPITMYTTTWCGHCERARRWMRAHALRFTEHDVEASDSASRAHKALNPRGGVPVIDIDGQVLVGFSEAHVARALTRAAERRIR